MFYGYYKRNETERVHPATERVDPLTLKPGDKLYMEYGDDDHWVTGIVESVTSENVNWRKEPWIVVYFKYPNDDRLMNVCPERDGKLPKIVA